MPDLTKLLCAELKRQLGAPGRCVPRIPAGGELLWAWFLDLNRTRRMGFSGPEPLSYGEIAAYAQLTRWPLEPRHIATLLAMDRVLLDHYDRQRETREGAATVPLISERPISAGMIDAMFG